MLFTQSQTNPSPEITIWRWIWQSYRLDFIKVIILNLLNASVGVATIAFINHDLLSDKALTLSSLLIFFGLIVALLIVTFVAQLALTNLGHGFVQQLRQQLIKQVLDTDISQLQHIGSAKILASLSTDIQALTTAFVRLPELIQGVILCLGAGLYLANLSLPLLIVVAVWIFLTIIVSGQLVKRVYFYLEKIRLANDKLYQDYQTMLDGQVELKLHRPRAKRLYDKFCANTQDYRQHIVKADTYHLSAVNWSNIMMFASIGLVLVISQLWHLADMAVATTFCITILFIQTPLLSAVGAYPTLQSAHIALQKITALNLVKYQQNFDLNQSFLKKDWRFIELSQAAYHYSNPQDSNKPEIPSRDIKTQDKNLQNFALSPINFRLNRGEVVFLMGANGSGKTTFAKLLTGLYLPTDGTLSLTLDDSNHENNVKITADNLADYRQLFSPIFSDFYLFDTLMSADGSKPNISLVTGWLERLQIEHKTKIIDDIIQDTQLSQGQRKRLAMLLAVAEEKPILLLDEWAADQDPSFRRYFYQYMIPLLKSMGKTLLVISHDDSYFDTADRLLLMKNGKLSELKGAERMHASQDAFNVL